MVGRMYAIRGEKGNRLYEIWRGVPFLEVSHTSAIIKGGSGEVGQLARHGEKGGGTITVAASLGGGRYVFMER